MKTYARFYQTGLTSGQLIEACGDRSCIKLDGRQSQLTHEYIAEQECRKRGYVGWVLLRGYSLLNAKPITRVSTLYY